MPDESPSTPAPADSGEGASKPATPAQAPPAAAPAGESAAAKALKAAQEAIARAKAGQIEPTVEPEPEPAPPPAAAPAVGSPAPFTAPAVGPVGESKPAEGIDLLGDVNLQVKIELGRTRMLVEDVLRLSEGSVVELDKLAGDPVDVYVNERPVARGEVLVLNDNFCIRINEITGLSGAGDDARR
ncbi:MAG: flagellar motor switch protein FliN [Phycisphaerae bacterium]|nr:flagellar motor switch protein FliN [Phycisphaerae bacterium]